MFKDFEAAQARRESAKMSRKKTLTTIGLMLASFVLGWNHLWLHSTNSTATVVTNTENTTPSADAQNNASLSTQPSHEEVTGAATTTASTITSNTAPIENPNQVSISLELPKPEPVATQAAPAASEPGLDTPIVIPDPSANNANSISMPAAPQASGEVE